MVTDATTRAAAAFRQLTIAERAMPLESPALLQRGSVVEPQTIVTQSPQGTNPFDVPPGLSMFYLAGSGDGIQPWGLAPTYRDRQLRAFLPTETFTMGAIGTIVATNMGLDWIVEGPPKLVGQSTDMLHNAQFGEGLAVWTGKMSTDYYTQDKGAFTEFVRDFDTPLAPVVGMNHLDAARCWHTGNREVPVLYQDRLGKWHGLKWYQVATLREMPAPHEMYYGLQYSALTRILQVCQLLRNIFTLHLEQTSGRHTRKVIIIGGVNKNEIETAIKDAQMEADIAGSTRYMIPVIVTALDPEHAVTKQEIALADLPEDWAGHLDDYMKWFMVAMSMGLLRDYQDFAPMPGGGLGQGQQSQVLHDKARGKGSQIWQKSTANMINMRGLLPRNCVFKYDEADLGEEETRAQILDTTAAALQSLINSGTFDPDGARELMLKAKLIDQDFFDRMQDRAVEIEARRKADQAEAMARLQQQGDPNADPNEPNAPARPAASAPRGTSGQARPGASGDEAGARELENGSRHMTLEFDDERVMTEDAMTTRARRALETHGRDIRRKLGDLTE